uniref:Peptidoglycan binding-like domain-containing protein n=1 Tax=Plectus sambesii TaxID=2011161 RepID=A0A914UWJ3_9BILA
MKWQWPKALFLLPALTTLVNAAGSSASDARAVPSRVTNYLTRFGYLSEPAPGTSFLRTHESVKSAVVRLQRFAGLEPTGELDEATVQLLSAKRCGLPDFEKKDWSADGEHSVRHRHRHRRHPRHHHRGKRYLLQGLKWGHTNLTYRYVGGSEAKYTHLTDARTHGGGLAFFAYLERLAPRRIFD